MIEKLAALVPPPRLNLIRYHGVLAPNAADREQIVPAQPPAQEDPTLVSPQPTPQTAGSHRLSWAALLARVFDIDINVCPACGGPMRIIAALTDALSTRCYLQGIRSSAFCCFLGLDRTSRRPVPSRRCLPGHDL